MKTNNRLWIVLWLWCIGNMSAGLFEHSPKTAFEARAIASDKVNESARTKLIQVYGERSKVGLHPVLWRFLFWDGTASQSGRAVTVVNGVVEEIRDGYTELDKLRLAAYKEDEIMDPAQLKVNSNEALKKITKLGSLKDVKLSSTEFLLSKSKGNVQPIWHVKLFADKAGTEVEVGQITMSANTGEMFEVNLSLEKLK